MNEIENIIGYIYKITSPNNKVYIGQTINISNRKRKYKYKEFKKQTKLWNNCEKYDWNPLDTFEIIEECLCGKNKEIINNKEIYWISFYNSHINGLNCTSGGEGNTGRKHTEETKEKLRKANLGKKHTEETKIKIGKFNKNRVVSEETREKLKNRVVSDQTIQKIKETKKLNPYKHSDLIKQHISECNKGNKKRLGKVHSVETKQKISDSKIGIPGKSTTAVLCLTNNKIYNSMKEAAIDLGINASHISCVCSGKRKSTCGFKFKYLENKKENKNEEKDSNI